MSAAWLMMLTAGAHLADIGGRSCVAHAAGLPSFCFWLGVGSGFCLAALALVISLGFHKK